MVSEGTACVHLHSGRALFLLPGSPQLAYVSGGHSPITRSLSAPTTTSCSSAEKRSFPEVDLTSNIFPRALNPLDPKTEQKRGHIKEEWAEEPISYWITSKHLNSWNAAKRKTSGGPEGFADLGEKRSTFMFEPKPLSCH